MDYHKIREFVRQSHPKAKFVADDQLDPTDAADGSESDVDAGNFKLSTWKKFGAAPAAAANDSEDSMTSERSNPRDKFRRRTLTGGATAAGTTPDRGTSGSARSSALRREAGKIALERLQLTPEGAASDSSEDSLDVLVDEESGIIGESDSGPETRSRHKPK